MSKSFSTTIQTFTEDSAIISKEKEIDCLVQHKKIDFCYKIEKIYCVNKHVISKAVFMKKSFN